MDIASAELKVVKEYAARLARLLGAARAHCCTTPLPVCGTRTPARVGLVQEYGPLMVICGVLLGVPGWLVWRRYRRARASLM